MGAKDRSLLASLGFKDPDKGDNRHDIACQYMSQPKTLKRLVAMLEHYDSAWVENTDTGKFELSLVGSAGSYYRIAGDSEYATTGSFDGNISTTLRSTANCEVVISKGSGQYRRTVGFIDVIANMASERLVEGMFTSQEPVRQPVPVPGRVSPFFQPPMSQLRPSFIRPSALPIETQKVTRHVRFTQHLAVTRIAIEVKIGRVFIGDVLRQVKLYRDLYEDGPIIRHWVLATAYDILPADRAMLTAEKIAHVRLGKDFEEFVQQRDAHFEGAQIEI